MTTAEPLDTAAPDDDGSPWLDFDEAVAYVRSSRTQLTRFVKDGRVRAYRLAGSTRALRIPRADLDALILDYPVEVDPDTGSMAAPGDRRRHNPGRTRGTETANRTAKKKPRSAVPANG
ncbi:helix-turn-helix domain-containing protein [Gordonia sp. CPCC 206044]|uniref:helix-turn-helix domain-containing protein n=1 Tax=Gordonia sp. CPCC 206044 TaxID=3140793 RepID=UPI003AF343C0